MLVSLNWAKARVVRLALLSASHARHSLIYLIGCRLISSMLISGSLTYDIIVPGAMASSNVPRLGQCPLHTFQLSSPSHRSITVDNIQPDVDFHLLSYEIR